MSETIETIPKAQTSVQTLNGTSLMNLVIKQESTGAATSEEGEEEVRESRRRRKFLLLIYLNLWPKKNLFFFLYSKINLKLWQSRPTSQ